MTIADLAEEIGDPRTWAGRRLPVRLGDTRVRLREVHADHVVVSAPTDVLRRLKAALREERAP